MGTLGYPKPDGSLKTDVLIRAIREYVEYKIVEDICQYALLPHTIVVPMEVRFDTVTAFENSGRGDLGLVVQIEDEFD